MLSNQIPNYIASGSPLGLRRLMIKTNAKHGLTIRYLDIQFVNNKWFAWYFINLKNTDEVFNEKVVSE